MSNYHLIDFGRNLGRVVASVDAWTVKGAAEQLLGYNIAEQHENKGEVRRVLAPSELEEFIVSDEEYSELGFWANEMNLALLQQEAE